MARFGPTVALLGTLHAKHGEQSVHRINLTLTRERDRSTHGFEWLAFRGRGMALTDNGNAPMEFPTPILVAPLQPRGTTYASSTATYVTNSCSMDSS